MLKVKVWNAGTGKLLHVLQGHYNIDDGTDVLQFAPDSRRLFSGGPRYSAIWDARTGKDLKGFNN